MKTLKIRLYGTLTLFGLMICFLVSGAPKKKDIQKLNNVIIFNLFMNYELTEKNGNMSTIIDYCPDFNSTTYKSISIASNMGNEDEILDFEFNETGNLNKIAYTVSNKIYKYDFIYEKDLLTGVNIGGNKKIGFTYDNKGRLMTISREKGGGTLEYNFEYLEKENKAKINLFVIKGEKRLPSKNNYFISWNNEFKLTAFNFDRYTAKAITYSATGELTSYLFSTSNADNVEARWNDYIIDDKGNWTERKDNKLIFKRTIVYK